MIHRMVFFRELVKRMHAKFEVILPCIFNFIVADAVQALDKHHHGRHAGCRDFGASCKGPLGSR